VSTTSRRSVITGLFAFADDDGGTRLRGDAAGGLRFDVGKAACEALAVGIEQRPADSDLIRESVRRLLGYQDRSTSHIEDFMA